jgi:hypothetical protein
LENEEKGQVATQTPFSGTFDQNQIDVWAAVANLLRNAFIQALREGFDPGRQNADGEEQSKK